MARTDARAMATAKRDCEICAPAWKPASETRKSGPACPPPRIAATIESSSGASATAAAGSDPAAAASDGACCRSLCRRASMIAAAARTSCSSSATSPIRKSTIHAAASATSTGAAPAPGPCACGARAACKAALAAGAACRSMSELDAGVVGAAGDGTPAPPAAAAPKAVDDGLRGSARELELAEDRRPATGDAASTPPIKSP